ncbi:HAMP domain-containing protein [bacterium]|nr:MAG: HAMP domain-containing protein [bacterium]
MKHRLRLPRALAFKIFGAFWVAMTLAGVFLLALETSRTERLILRARAINRDAVAFYAVSLAKDHEDPQTSQSRDFLQDLQTRTGIRAWLFDAKGVEVSGYDPSGLRYIKSQAPKFQQLREQSETTPGTSFEPLNGFTLAANTAMAPSGRRYTFVGALPQSRFGPWNATPAVQALRLLAVLVTAGVVSGIVARYLTRSIGTLRATTHRLAQGDWSARVTPSIEAQRDELGDLARDFNLMAQCLETSMSEQSRLIIAQKRLLADVAHELRSPLARISVALELARDAQEIDSPPSVSLTPAHDRIEREVGRLSELIARLLTLSRLESGVQSRDDTSVDLHHLLESVTADANYEASPNKSVTLQVAPRPTPNDAYVVLGTPDLLRSAVENVIRNAVRHTSVSTTVEVMLSDDSKAESEVARWQESTESCFVSPAPITSDTTTQFAVITVRDQGPGLPADELREVFRPFYRAGQGRTPRDGGVGLGLSIVLRAIEIHGGQVRVCNAANGGLQVELRLPTGA